MRGPIGGHFVWREGDGGPLLLIGGGSGVAPLMAMLRHRATVSPDTDALLVYSARTWEELIFRDELLVSQIGSFYERPVGYQGDFTNSQVRDVCGSNSFVEAITTSLVLEAIPPGRIRTERYGGKN